MHYHNILVLTQDKKKLSTIDQKRKKFYLKNDLAIENGEYEDFPDSIILTFEPDIQSEREYQITQKENRCVICGQEHDLELHHVVPYCIVRNLDDRYKHHRSHWCVLLCEEHHAQADKANRFFHDELQNALKIDLQCDHKNILNALHRLYVRDHWDKIPLERQKILLDKANLSNIDELKDYTPDSKNRINFVDTWIKEWVNGFDSIESMHEPFREAFMKLNPQYLPKGYLIFDF